MFDPFIARVKLAQNAWLKTVASQHRPLPQQYVLEVGIGGDKARPSDNYKWFSTSNYHTLDMDAQYEPTIVADITKWIPERTYEYIICTQTLEHIWDYKAALSTCYAASAPHGYFILCTPFMYPYHYSARNPDEEDYWRFTAPALGKILKEAGWRKMQLDMPDEVLTVAVCQK